MKKGLFITFLLLFILSTFCFVGCSACDSDEKETVYNVWSVPSTVKILQNDIDYSNKGVAEISISAVKNEYESTQLIVSMLSSAENYYLQKTDLFKDEKIFSKDNIEIYNQHFSKVNELYDLREYGEGMYPDALIPIDKAKEAGELIADESTNIEFWITFYIPKDTEAGIYTSNFILTVNGEETSIPVKLKVYDYTLTDKINAETLFTARYNRIGMGEKDNSIEMMEEYYDFFLKYRIALENLPIESLTPSETVETALKYYDITTRYSLTNYLGDRANNILGSKNLIKNTFLALAENSTQEKNLISKVCVYGIDEPDPAKESMRNSVISQMNGYYDLLAEIVSEIENDTIGKYDSFKLIDNWQECILEIPFIIPHSTIDWIMANKDTEEGSRYLEALDVLCPQFSSFTDYYRDDFFALCDEYDIDLWWYGCIMPVAPYTTYHIGDTNLLSSRTIGWLQKKYNIKGNLYWGAASYATEDKEDFEGPLDLYKTPYLYGGCAGDGYLCYAGAKYGVYGPLPSNRLMSIRDGMEEYEILLDLEQKYKELFEEYALTGDSSHLLDTFYDNLAYSGLKMNKDGQNGLDFSLLRNDLLVSAEEIENESGFLVYDLKIVDNIARLKFCVRDGYSVIVNNQDLLGSNNKYEYTTSLLDNTIAEIVIKKGGKEFKYSKLLGSPVKYLVTFDDWTNRDLDSVSLSEGGSCSLVTDTDKVTSGQALEVVVTSKITSSSIDNLRFKPNFAISTSMLKDISDFSKISTLSLDIYNNSENSVKATIILAYGNSNVEVGSISLNKGYNGVSLSIDSVKWDNLSKTDRIIFQFKNDGTIDNPTVYAISVDSIYTK